ncbi:MAG: polysaccharide biosynthesis C-terminal domain-containing protein [Bacteroidales bacterium]|nr:polysaccharide biosynthesis C-terminal domain-containing protein [Bacteroidales bacterium]
MAELKSLAKDTVIYGVSTIIGKFLNWLMVPIYTRVLPCPADYGIITHLYAWSALLIAILTYGMETGFFRYVAKEKTEAGVARVYSTTLTSLAFTSTLFLAICIIWRVPIATTLGYADHPEYTAMLFATVAMDAFCSIPFSYLRYVRKSITFALLKLLMIAVNVTMNIFFLIVCPRLNVSHPELISWFYAPDYGVGYILVANVFSTAIGSLALMRYVVGVKWHFSWPLLKEMLNYSWPLLLLSVVGVANQSIDKILFPLLTHHSQQGMDDLGVYGACFKIAMVMMMFTYAFKFAYEPFVFGKSNDRDSTETYALAMKYYIITSLLIFLGMVANIGLLGLLIDETYRHGLKIIPIVLATYLFQGVFYNLSLWYKLTDKTIYGAIFSLLGLVITVIIDIIFVPHYSYMAAVWATFISFFIIMVLSYAIGKKYYPVPYDLKAIGIYVAITIVLFVPMQLIDTHHFALDLVLKNLLLIPMIIYITRHDLPLSALPVVGKYFKKKTHEATPANKQ